MENMSHAHDPSGQEPAHSSDHTRLRPKYLHLDTTGVSLSWGTATGIVGALVAGVLAWAAFRDAVATKAEVRETTQIVLEPGAAPVTIASVVQRHDHQAAETREELQRLGKRVDDTGAITVSVRNGFFEDRAERLADRAADKVPDPRRSREVWQRVKAQAAQNQAEGRPLRDGLEQLLDR
jgi:hypothetical protein